MAPVISRLLIFYDHDFGAAILRLLCFLEERLETLKCHYDDCEVVDGALNS